LKPSAASLRSLPVHHLAGVCKERINPRFLKPNPSGVNSRQSIFTPELTFFAFLDQVLHTGSSCRRAASQVRAYHQAARNCPHIKGDDGAYCVARARWTLEELVEVRCDLSNRISVSADNLCAELALLGHALKVVDGTSFNAPDTKANRKAYPQSTSQRPHCGFPLINLTGIFSLSTGALLQRAYGSAKLGEISLFHQLWPTLEEGDIILGDRLFGSYCDTFGLKHRGVDSIWHHHASRNADFRTGVRLGPMDRLVTWSKPLRKPLTVDPALWGKVPDTLQVRMIRFQVSEKNGRAKEITLVTTLTDPVLWPAVLLARLYARRWKIELYWDDIKTTLQMDMLSCKTPKMIEKEMEMHFIAYNLIRSLMAEAVVTCHGQLDRMSFKGTLDALGIYSPLISKLALNQGKRRTALYSQMLAAIALDQLPLRPDRREPRCRKRRPKAYPLMTKPRSQMKDRPKGGYRARK
jgi:hypothetical protein